MVDDSCDRLLIEVLLRQVKETMFRILCCFFLGSLHSLGVVWTTDAGGQVSSDLDLPGESNWTVDFDGVYATDLSEWKNLSFGSHFVCFAHC